MNVRFFVNGSVSIEITPASDLHRHLMENILKAATDGQVFTVRLGAEGGYVIESAQAKAGAVAAGSSR